jgi:predicted DNA-binding transcriptional regulator YafY
MDSMNRHEQVLRLFHLVDILFSARGPLLVEEIRDDLRSRGAIDDMSDKNLRRDLEFLGQFGYRMRKTKKRSSRGTNRDAFEIDPNCRRDELKRPDITLVELLSLAAAQRLLAPLAGTFYWRGIEQVFEKLGGVATPELLAYAEKHSRGLVVHPLQDGRRYCPRLLGTINRAILGHVELDLRYAGALRREPRTYRMRPEALVLYEGALYVAGWLVYDDGNISSTPRFFKLDRLEDAQQSGRTFRPSSRSVEEHLAESITLFRSSSPGVSFRIRVDEPRAKWARERPFHPAQTVVEHEDGSITLQIPRAWPEEIVPRLLGLAGHAEILEPVEARGLVAEAAERIVARHARGGGDP